MAGVFKTYDIRGIYGKGINTALAYKIGRAFARFLKKNTYMIGTMPAPTPKSCTRLSAMAW